MRDPEAERRVNFVREGTAIAPVPFVPEVTLWTATEVTPLWQATEDWLKTTGAGIPFWAVPWAGGQALARYILDRKDTVRGLTVVDFGSGSGLVAIAAKLAGAKSVRALDIDPLACTATELNAELNEVEIEIECADRVGEIFTEDVVLAGDIWYERESSERFARFLEAQTARVLTGDPSRTYPPPNARVLATYEVPTTVELESVSKRTARVLEIGKLGP